MIPVIVILGYLALIAFIGGIAFKKSKEKKLISQTNLGGPVYSTPIVANGVLYVHSNTHLFAFYDARRQQMPTDVKPKVEIELNKPDGNK